MSDAGDLPLVLQALAFAADRHRDQRRKDAAASPYINHPIALANVLVREGEAVQKNQAIAIIGSTGRSTGTHVHFEVERDGNRLNPMRYLSAP